ncbi:signal peptidase II [Tropicimonas isoalkanivorans]|uniref:Lipoprotein signal peptidase n=1 Tax=Tropicimonas isoalkanivorans TaxID=441112 RepID=A0A1I1NVJ2_9RHOB|nr:signal peptidase II [Tropicimonas isoalkanivorans]SFD01445.1 signal peptidase II [Tropicimonas isoalkanivorans]
MRLLWVVAVAAFLIDQWSKFHVYHVLDLAVREHIPVIPPLLEFRKGFNTGVNFGLFAGSADGQRWFLIGLTLVLCAGLLIWARRSFTRWIEFASAGMILGGALGNALDRLIYPGVRDFLNMSCCGIDNPYVFNVADVFIFAGAIGLVLFGGERKRRNKPS